MIFILGNGPSGIIAANYLLLNKPNADFRIIAKQESSGSFDSHKIGSSSYKVGQKTLFHNKEFGEFLDKAIYDNDIDTDNLFDTRDMSDTVSVFFKGKYHGYPLQNHINQLSLSDKIRLFWTYYNRPKYQGSSYAEWVISNYGKWMAENILMPHTWKTLKDDLYNIDSSAYGKKVVPLNLFRKNSVYEFVYSEKILGSLFVKVQEKIINGLVTDISDNKIYYVTDRPEAVMYEKIINTIPLPFLPLGKNTLDEHLALCKMDLDYNNMFCGVFVVPNAYIHSDKSIIYFPERKFIFSKISLTKNRNYTVICCECSFRRNDNDKFQNKNYQDRFMSRIENDLKMANIIDSYILSTCTRFSHIVSPCYILTHNDNNRANEFLQGYCEDHNIYNLGRFAQWLPNMRVEQSISRIEQIVNEAMI